MGDSGTGFTDLLALCCCIHGKQHLLLRQAACMLHSGHMHYARVEHSGNTNGLCRLVSVKLSIAGLSS